MRTAALASISLIEAISHGKCVLASDIPENLEVVEDCAVTFQARDVHDLREKMRGLLDDPARVGAVAERCRRHAERHYSWTRIVEATEAVYLDLIGRRSKPLKLPASARRRRESPRLTVVK